MTELVLSQTFNELVLEDAGTVLEMLEQNVELLVGTEQGPPGPPGEPGPSGANGAPTYNLTQITPAKTWFINHNLGFKPDVSLLSVGSVEIEGSITHLSNNLVVAQFSIATAGFARCI